jgi:hypothetical protein
MAEEIKSLSDLETVAGGEAVVEVAAPREPVRDALGRSLMQQVSVKTQLHAFGSNQVQAK